MEQLLSLLWLLQPAGIYNQSKNETQLSDLALANVEALANGESGGSFGCGNAAYEWIVIGMKIQKTSQNAEVVAPKEVEQSLIHELLN